MAEVDDILARHGRPASPAAPSLNVDDILARHGKPAKTTPTPPALRSMQAEAPGGTPARVIREHNLPGWMQSVPQEKLIERGYLPESSRVAPGDEPLPLAKTPSIKPEALAVGGIRGLSAEFADEALGLAAGAPFGGSVGPGIPVSPEPVRQSSPEAGRRARDEARAYMGALEQAEPTATVAGQVAGSIASPVNKLGPAVKGGPIQQVARAGTRAGLQGAVIGAGASTADLTKGEWAPFLMDVGKSAAVSGAVGTAGETGAQVVKGGGTAVLKNLKKRLLNEAAEGTAATTDTARKHLVRAGDAIYDEIVFGPDGDTVRKAIRGPAEKGRETLEPIIQDVGATLETNYRNLKARGVDVVDMEAYQQGLMKARAEAIDKGRKDLADGIWNHMQEVFDFAKTEAGGDLSLMQLRGLTTQTQKAAASAVGSFNEHAAAKLKRQLSGIASVAMDDMLETAGAKGGKSAQEAVENIRGLNKRYFALKTLDDALERRVSKESTGKSAFVRGAEKISTPLAITAGGAEVVRTATGEKDPEDVLWGLARVAAVTAAGKAIPALAKGAERATTTAGIKAARGQPVVPAKIGVGVTRAVSAAAAREMARKVSDAKDLNEAKAAVRETLKGGKKEEEEKK